MKYDIEIRMTEAQYEKYEAYLEQMSLDLTLDIKVTDSYTNDHIMLIAGKSI